MASKETLEVNQAQADKEAVIAALRKTLLDPDASVLDKTRCADTLGRLAGYGWFEKPERSNSPRIFN